MPTNDFVSFATASGANVLTQAQYLALSALSTGFQSGVAPSVQLNKVWRQSSIMAAMLAQFVVDYSGQPAIDDGTTATLEGNLATAVRNAGRTAQITGDTGAVNAYVTANPVPLTALTLGTIQYLLIGHTNTGASTFAPDGLATKQIVGLGALPLQGGELVANGLATLFYNSLSAVWILLDCYGGTTQVPAGTQSNHAVNLGQFSSSLGSGWQKLASGLLIQWGALGVPEGATTTYSFPIAFPGLCLSIVASKGSSISTTAEYTVGIQSISASQFKITNSYPNTSSSQSVSYMAIGY